MKIDIERIDLAKLACELAERFAGSPAAGYVVGRTLWRDAVEERLSCSALEAEQLVDTMIARGILRFEQEPDTLGAWVIGSTQPQGKSVSVAMTDPSFEKPGQLCSGYSDDPKLGSWRVSASSGIETARASASTLNEVFAPE